jgi:hypothetical protein
MEIGDEPIRIRLVTADQAVALGLGAGGRLREARHLEGDVMKPGTATLQETMEEAIVSRGLDHLDGAAALVAPRSPPESAAGTARVRNPPEPSDQYAGGVGHPGHADGDVIELRREPLTHRPCSVRHAASAIVSE